ncbi:ribbon-helix-helix domain-containing protein [Aciditerrimonas ferrireducens]|uniref:Ribbon-helix-helix domain-containing protein n=1 Tax=Aciditerrimonas ferrireducens TaxID=667306 RepID=A0ABV6BZT1_9ACTN
MRRRVGRPPAPPGDRWVDRIRRAAYYLDVAVLEDLEHYCARTGATKSEVVRDALRAWLDQHTPTRH